MNDEAADTREEATAATGKRVPALVVSGFLGSGKTTLVRRLLQSAREQGLRAAVVSNEFGELGIDQALLGSEAQDYVELDGGCVCCKLSDALLESLQTLYERADPDRIIVETSGVAMPFDTLINFWREPVCRWSEDEVSVVVVNAEQVAERRELAGTFEDQVSSGDLIVLNKIDLIESSRLDEIEAVLREMEPDAPIIRASYCEVEEAVLFPPDPGDALRKRRGGSRRPAHGRHDYEADEIAVAPGADPAEIAARLSSLDALRIKGFVSTSEGLRLVQGVGRRVELSATDVEPRPEMIGRVVAIRRSARS